MAPLVDLVRVVDLALAEVLQDGPPHLDAEVRKADGLLYAALPLPSLFKGCSALLEDQRLGLRVDFVLLDHLVQFVSFVSFCLLLL